MVMEETEDALVVRQVSEVCSCRVVLVVVDSGGRIQPIYSAYRRRISSPCYASQSHFLILQRNYFGKTFNL